MPFIEWLRVTVRMLTIGVATLGVFVIRIIAMPCGLIFPRGEAAVRRGLLKLWGRTLTVLASIRVTVTGTAPLEGQFSVSNHLSFADVLVLSRLLGCTFVARADAAHWPIAGVLARSVNTVFVDRARPQDTVRANARIKRALDLGDRIHVFAEGGILSDGSYVAPFKPSLLQPAVERDVPVHFAALSYTTPAGSPPASKAVFWSPGTSFMRSVISLLRLPHVDACVVFGDGPIVCDDRKELAARLHEAVTQQFKPLL